MLDAPDEKPKDDAQKGGIALIVALALVFFPAFILGWGYYGLIRFFKQKMSVIATTVVIVDIIAIAYWYFGKAWENILYVLDNISQIKEVWVNLLPAVIPINLIIGGFFGLLIVFVQIRQIKNNPHKLKLEGSWLYNFKFRRTPWQVLRRKQTIKGLKEGHYSNDEKAPLGLDEENGDKIAYRYNSEAVRQTLISGAAGSGKTITMLSMIHNDIQAGKPVIVTDFKRSPELASKIASWAKANGRDFYHFVNGDPEKYDVNDSPGQAFYDALINGGASKADMVLGMREYDTAAEVYKSSMRQLLQVLFQMLRHADRSKAPNIDWDHGGIYQVASAVTGGNFTDIVGACEGTPIQKNAEEVEIGLRSRTSNLSKAMSELQGQMRTIVASEYGRWLRTEKDKRNIDLYELTKDGSDAVILFSLNSDSEKDFSKYIGSLILSDLNAVSAKRRNNGLKNQVMVYIDEFQAVPPTAVTSLLEKSRESKLAMTLSSQSYEQIIAAADKNGESYLIGILDTCSNFIVHNGATEQSATRLSQIIGKHFETVYTTSNTNEGFLFSINWFNKRNQNVQTKSEERWIAHPKKFMSLSSPNGNNDYKSTAIIINKSPDDPLFENSEGGAVFRTVWMIPNREVVNDYYNPRLASDDNYDETKLVPALAELTGAGGENSILEDNEVPVDYLSEKLGESSQNTFTEEYDPAGYNDEDLDGDFGFEVIDDNDEFEDIENINYDPLPDFDINEHPQKRNNNNIFDSAAPKPTKKHRSSLESSSFNDLFNSNDFDSKNLRREPTRKQPVKKDKNYEDEDALPDIDGLM